MAFTPAPDEFETKAQPYSAFVQTDPMRLYLHYPAVERKIYPAKGKRMLDVGCGDGFFSRRLAALGAHVTGYDVAPSLIDLAKEAEKAKPLGIEYHVATPETFRSSARFEHAVSVMVLPYAPNAHYLRHFFINAHAHLKPNGTFTSVVLNPHFTAFGDVIGNRRFIHKPGASQHAVEVNFLNPHSKELVLSAHLTQFTVLQYADAARAAGFDRVQTEPLMPNHDGLRKLGAAFWNPVTQTQPYALITVKK